MSRGDDQARPEWLTVPDKNGWMSCVKCDETYYVDEIPPHCTGCRKIRRDMAKAALQGMLAKEHGYHTKLGVVTDALEVADALLAELEKGGP